MTEAVLNEAAKEYAAALFMLALEEEAQDEYLSQLCLVEDMLLENPAYSELLSSPAIGITERLSALDAAFSSTLSENVMSFLRLLCENGRMGGFFECVHEYKRLLMEHKKASVARVTSALPLTQEECEKLRLKLEDISGHSVRIESIQDKSIIGGLVIEIDGKVIDGSVRGKLADVKDVISR